MRKPTAIILLLCITLLLTSCTTKEEFEYPVTFHYLRSTQANDTLSHGAADSVIAPELREGAEYRNDLELMLDIYLHGPLDKAYVSPYPVGTTLRQLTLEGTAASVVLSDHFASLTGMDLSLACACMTMTVMELTDAESVTISTESGLPDGMEAVTMTRSDLILVDTATPVTD